MVRVSRVLLRVRDGGFGISKSLLEILVCPLSKQPLRMCEQSNSLISDAIGVAYPIVDGIPCLVPKDGKMIDTDDIPKPAGAADSPNAKGMSNSLRRFHPHDCRCSNTKDEAGWYRLTGVVKGRANDSRLGQAALDGEMCCVCLLRLEEGEDTRVLPCRHEFHRACVDRWLNGCRKTCPVCRFLVEDEEKSRVKEALTDEMVIWFSSFHVAGF